MTGTIGETWLLRQQRANEPMSSRHLAELLRKAERKAGLPKLPRGAWHLCRRKWASERQDLPAKDAMAAGGWQDERTFRVYQQAAAETTRAVIAHK